MKTIIIMAQSLDGIIAYDSDHAANWTSKEDKQFFIAETKKGGVVIFGRNTYKTFGGKPLPGRLNLVMTMDEAEKKLEKPGLVEYAVNQQPAQVIAMLKKRKFKKVFVGGGSIINSIFLDAGLVDELWITVEPKIFGTGLKIFNDKKRDINLVLKSVKKANQSVLLKYGVNYGNSN
jgi:dihydrofolate reductase